MARRVRWGNVGRAAAGFALVALVVAWPRLASPAPVVPGGAAIAVEPGGTGAPAGGADAGGAAAQAGRGPADEPDGVRAPWPGAAVQPRPRASVSANGGQVERRAPSVAKPGGAGRGDRTAKPGGPAPPTATAPATTPPAAEPPGRKPPTSSVPPPTASAPPAAPAPTVDPAEAEFGFER